MGHFGFSYIGLLWLLLLWIPNSMWAKRKTEGYDSSGESKVVLITERVGQVLCTAAILLFPGYNPETFELWTAWFVASAALMVIFVQSRVIIYFS
jgi:hypothetical protein